MLCPQATRASRPMPFGCERRRQADNRVPEATGPAACGISAVRKRPLLRIAGAPSLSHCRRRCALPACLLRRRCVGDALQRVALPSILGDGIPSPQNWIFAALPVLIGGALLDKASSSSSSFLLKAVTHNQRSCSSKNSSSKARLSRLSPPV